MNVLVIVSTEYGELGNALHFLAGLDASHDVVLLLPESLAHTAVHDPKFDVRAYASFGEVRRVVAETRPRVALLFSGYFLTIGRRLSLVNAFRLFRLLERSDCAVVTSDPLIGLMRGPSSIDFRSVVVGSSGALARAGEHAVARMLSLRLAMLYRRLRSAWQLFPAPPPAGGGVRSLAYFTPPHPSAAKEHHRVQPRTWVFVLSAIDWQMQRRRHGDAFRRQLSERLAEAADRGIHVVLLGSDSVAKAMGAAPTRAGITLVGAASYAEFVEQIRGAEYAFYWNYYSFSILQRVLVARPAFFFDAGHVVRLLPRIETAGIDMFYGGWRPPLLDLGAPFDETRLAELADRTCREFARIERHLATGLSPDDVLSRVAEGGV